jgi:hypothetical protein
MRCLICKDDPNAQRLQKDWNEEMDEKRLARHIAEIHSDALNLGRYFAKLQHCIYHVLILYRVGCC